MHVTHSQPADARQGKADKNLAGGDILSVVSELKPTTSVILIDAASSGTVPGTIHRIDANREAMPANLSFSSTHSMGVAEAIQLAQLFGTLPPNLLVLGIEGQNFAAGMMLSPAVEQAVNEVVELVAREVGESGK